MQMDKLLFNLHKIFKVTPFKFIVLIEHSDHQFQKLNKDVDIRQLELKVRGQSWWRMIF